MDIQKIILTIAQCAPGFLLAITFHEYAHGRVAKYFGDDTAEREGRLTLNPAAHIDPMGTVFFPLFLVAIGAGAFGWAKPVPVVTRNLRDVKRAMFWVALAGPLANFILAVLSAFFFAIIYVLVDSSFQFHKEILEILNYSVLINCVLGAFNLIPWPGLDGSRVLATFLKGEALRKYESLGQYTNVVFFGLIALSFMGIPTLQYIIQPFVFLGRLIQQIFIMILT
jgi:Zn-dependent protease